MTEKKMTITTDAGGRPIIDGIPAIAAADFELLIGDILAEEDDETDAPVADEDEDGAMYREAFARAEERVAARREIERLRAVIDRAGALAAQNASAEMIRAALEEAVANSRVSSEIPEEYRWDVEDRGRGPFGEADGLTYGIAIDRVIDFAVGKIDESRITEAREDLRRLRERSAAYALRNPSA